MRKFLIGSDGRKMLSYNNDNNEWWRIVPSWNVVIKSFFVLAFLRSRYQMMCVKKIGV